jgi:hypothetical protein
VLIKYYKDISVCGVTNKIGSQYQESNSPYCYCFVCKVYDVELIWYMLSKFIRKCCEIYTVSRITSQYIRWLTVHVVCTVSSWSQKCFRGDYLCKTCGDDANRSSFLSL